MRRQCRNASEYRNDRDHRLCLPGGGLRQGRHWPRLLDLRAAHSRAGPGPQIRHAAGHHSLADQQCPRHETGGALRRDDPALLAHVPRHHSRLAARSRRAGSYRQPDCRGDTGRGPDWLRGFHAVPPRAADAGCPGPEARAGLGLSHGAGQWHDRIASDAGAAVPACAPARSQAIHPGDQHLLQPVERHHGDGPSEARTHDGRVDRDLAAGADTRLCRHQGRRHRAPADGRRHVPPSGPADADRLRCGAGQQDRPGLAVGSRGSTSTR